MTSRNITISPKTVGIVLAVTEQLISKRAKQTPDSTLEALEELRAALAKEADAIEAEVMARWESY